MAQSWSRCCGGDYGGGRPREEEEAKASPDIASHFSQPTPQSACHTSPSGEREEEDVCAFPHRRGKKGKSSERVSVAATAINPVIATAGKGSGGQVPTGRGLPWVR
uniref:Uncharacterized protein n=1 Tax=Knipowitschia caucasica TaxID=637954 RepID=A0AAV2KR82_KNICA